MDDNRFDALHPTVYHYLEFAEGTVNLWVRYDSKDKEIGGGPGAAAYLNVIFHYQ